MDKQAKAEPPTITVWITKYALTSGVIRAAVAAPQRDERYIRVHIGGAFCAQTFGPGQWYRAEAEAMAHVTKLIAAKRKSLNKAIVKLATLQAQVKAGTLPVIDASGKDAP